MNTHFRGLVVGLRNACQRHDRFGASNALTDVLFRTAQFVRSVIPERARKRCELKTGGLQDRTSGFRPSPVDRRCTLGLIATRCTLDVSLLTAYSDHYMIKSFRDRACQRLWMGELVKRFSGLEKQALQKLDMLHTARQLNDLRAPPANRLEALTGSRQGQHSIRINDQWRICFTWTEEGPSDVEIVDYH